MNFLPHVEKVILQAREKPSIQEQLNFVFKNLSGICVTDAKNLSQEKQKHFHDFFFRKNIVLKRRKLF